MYLIFSPQNYAALGRFIKIKPERSKTANGMNHRSSDTQNLLKNQSITKETPGKGFSAGNDDGVKLKPSSTRTKETILLLFCSTAEPQIEQYQTFTQTTRSNQCTVLFFNTWSLLNSKQPKKKSTVNNISSMNDGRFTHNQLWFIHRSSLVKYLCSNLEIRFLMLYWMPLYIKSWCGSS